MTRLRSPNYPAMSLPEAIAKIGIIHEKEHHLSAPRDVMAQHLGYAGINGSSLKALSALLKYGLLEKTTDDQRKVTELALKILHPDSEEEKASAIQEAASRPALFIEIAKNWPNGTPSDENLKSYLKRRNFGSDAIPEVIKAYKETSALVTEESKGYATPDSDPNGRQDRENREMQTAQQNPSGRTPQPGPAPFLPEEVGAFVASQVNRSTLTLEEGSAVLEIPASISKRSQSALKLWFELILKLAATDSTSIPSSS